MSTYIKARNGKVVPQRADLVTRHLGIIAQRSIFWYRMLPNHARNSYDIEDMISDVVLHVVKRSHQHNPSRGKESTFVWHTADNKCKSILMHYRTKQYSSCGTVELTPDLLRKMVGYEADQDQEITCENVAQIPNPNSDLDQFCLSLNAVERVIELGSDRLLNLIEQVFTGSVNLQNFRSSTSCTNDIFEEMKALAKAQSATLEDFLRVYRYISC